MSFVQLVSAFRLYGADVLLLALGVTLTTSLLKKTVLKTFPKLFVFLPFILGVVYFAVYRMIATGSIAPLAADLGGTLCNGFGCGCAATLYSVVCEKFLQGKTKANPLAPLLEFIPEEKREEAAKTLYEEAKNLSGEELRKYFEETLNTFADPPMSETELLATAELLAEYMDSLEKK